MSQTQQTLPIASPVAVAGPHQALIERFDIAGGSVIGHEHRRLGRNNQDAMAWYADAGVIVAVVADGCGSSRHSEVGARLGARLMVAALARLVGAGGLDAGISNASQTASEVAAGQGTDSAGAAVALVTQARDEVLGHLRGLARVMAGSLAQTVSDYFLFTLVGAAMTPARCLVFSMGDGVIVVNGAAIPLGPFPGNQPPYPAYALLDGDAVDAPAAPRVHALMPTAALDSLVLATDGAEELVAHPDHALPGSDERAGPLHQFCDPRYHRNPDAIRRRLWLMNRDHVVADWDRRRIRRARAVLADDTTLISIRRTSGRSA
ncbi:protein phosphatase 2C domain-containing protein [Haliangium sp.]|uniref:protein phosphatase 2C domain-containing protein n=1 Tax=Haliangium sp. TaxID=2663208 RepID=UPI003D0A67B4